MAVGRQHLHNLDGVWFSRIRGVSTCLDLSTDGRTWVREVAGSSQAQCGRAEARLYRFWPFRSASRRRGRTTSHQHSKKRSNAMHASARCIKHSEESVQQIDWHGAALLTDGCRPLRDTHCEIVPQVLLDLKGLRRRLHDHQAALQHRCRVWRRCRRAACGRDACRRRRRGERQPDGPAAGPEMGCLLKH